MSEFWAIFWLIIKYGFFIGLSMAIIATLIVVFHPICISIKGRGSIKGQRGEAKLSYLFGLLRLRCIASFHTQDVWLEFGGFKKLLQRVSVRENESIEDDDNKQDLIENVNEEELKERSLEDYKEKKEEIANNINESPKEEVVEKDSVQEKTTDSSDDITTSKQEIVEESKDSQSDKKDSTDETLLKEGMKESEEVAPSKEEVKETLSDDDFKVEATPEQLAELQNILEEEEKKKEQQEAKNKSKDSKNSFNAKLRKIKKDFNRRYEQVRSNLVLLKQKWKSLWPVIKRFWNRGKKGFRFHEAYVKVEYSLDEHYLTGMMCGYLAPAVGFAKRYGLNFEPIPVFPNIPSYGFYSKATWQFDIIPYRLIWAVTALLFEKNIYKELIWLYKLKKAKKTKNKS